MLTWVYIYGGILIVAGGLVWVMWKINSDGR